MKDEGFSPMKHSRPELACIALIVLIVAGVATVQAVRGQPAFTYDLFVTSQKMDRATSMPRKVFTSEPGSCLRGPLKIYGDDEIVMFELARGAEYPHDCGAKR